MIDLPRDSLRAAALRHGSARAGPERGPAFRVMTGAALTAP